MSIQFSANTPFLPQTGICPSCSTPLHQFQNHCSLCGKARQSKMHPRSLDEISNLPAPIFRRILACLLDYLIIAVWILALNQIFSFNHQKLMSWIDYLPQEDWFLLFLPHLASSILYFVIFHSLCSTSPGKWIYGITFFYSSSFLMVWRFLLREVCFAVLMMFFALPLLLIFFF